jgi:dolichol kinase
MKLLFPSNGPDFGMCGPYCGMCGTIVVGCCNDNHGETAAINIVSSGVYVSGVGDSMTALVGKTFGRHLWRQNQQRTTEGSAAMALSLGILLCWRRVPSINNMVLPLVGYIRDYLCPVERNEPVSLKVCIVSFVAYTL